MENIMEEDINYFDLLGRLSQQNGFVVLDSSFLCRLVNLQDIQYSGPEDELHFIRKEIELIKDIKPFFRDAERVLVTSEVVGESEQYNSKLTRKKKSKRRSSRIKTHRDWYGDAGRRKSLHKQVSNELKRLIRERHGLLNLIGLADDEIPEHYFESKTEGEPYKRLESTVLKLSEEHFGKNNITRYRGSTVLKDNEDNDEKILAKCFALSYCAPVSVLSSDSDFEHIYRAIYLNLDKIRSADFQAPVFDANLFLCQPHRFKVLTPRKVLRKRLEERTYQGI